MGHRTTSQEMPTDLRKNVEGSDANSSGFDEVDNSISVLAKIASLYAEQLMSDINLVVGGKNYPAHRLILCATSEVFQVKIYVM